MRIVAHNGAHIWGGAERATVALLEGLAQRGHDVLLLCNDPIVAAGAESRGVPAEVCIIGGDIALPDAFRLARVLRRVRPDALIVGTYKKLFYASLGARFARVPRVIARIGLESDTPRSLKYRVALRRWTDGVVVNARRMAGPFRELSGFDARKVHVIWNSVVPRNGSTRMRRELGIPETAFVFGTVARLAKQKRIDRLIEAASLVPEAHCIIAGDGALRAVLEAQAREVKLQPRVHFLGNTADVPDVLESLDLFVVSSDSEGMSNSMLEAMAAGVPVVSTDVSGAEDALAADADGGAAGVITEFSSRAIAEQIVRLMSDRALLQSMGDSARARARDRFSREAMLTAWEEILAG